MRELFDLVLEDKVLKELIVRTRGFSMDELKKPVVVMEHRSSRLGESYLTRAIYRDKKDYEKHFDDEQRTKYNGRTVIHEKDSDDFECLTNIPDNSTDKKTGHWIIMGYGAKNPKTKSRPFLMKEFMRKEDLEKLKEQICAQMDEWALVHQYGTTDYLIVQTQLLNLIDLP